MSATAVDAMTPTRRPIEGPSAWIGADMRAREAEWSYRLSPAEIAEIEAALHRCRRAASTSPTSAARTSRCRRLARCLIGCVARCSTGAASCCCAAFRSKAGRSPRAPRLLGSRHVFRQRAVAERQGASARARLRSGRAAARQSEYPQLRDIGAAELPHRSLRCRGAAVPAAREVGRAVGDRQLHDRA